MGSASGRGVELQATAVKAVLEEQDEPKIEVRFWRDAFPSGDTAVESLISALDSFDFGVFLLTPDDVRTIRGEKIRAPRDNVILELGLFTGSLGRDRTFIITPDDRELRLPTDLLGVTVGRYRSDWSEEEAPSLQDAKSALRGVATEIAARIAQLGPRSTGQTPETPRRTAGTGEEGVGIRADGGWIAAAKARALIPLDTLAVDLLNENVVHPDWGVGRVVEIGPERSGARIATVRFADGTTGYHFVTSLFSVAFVGRERPF